MKCIVVNLNKNRWLCATVDNLTQVMKLGSWTFCGHVIQFEIQPVNIPQMPPAPICGVWMTLKPPGSQENLIFHLRFLGHLSRQAMHHIQMKNHFGKSPSLQKNG
jgi:hypothetical protein